MVAKPSPLESRIDDVLAWTVRSLAEECHEVEGGWVARNRSLPAVHSLNRLQVIGEIEPAQILGTADEHLADLPYRHIEVRSEHTAALLEHELAARDGSGWKLEREVVMALGEQCLPARDGDRRPADATEPDVVVELSGEEMDELMRRWLVEENLDSVPGALDQLSEYNRREGALWHEHVLGVREEGRPVALTKSRSHDGVGWVEDVYTVPAARKKGYARLLVGRAIARARAAHHEPTFILADDNDWPKHLYAELGFEPIGHLWTFHRELAG